MGEKGMRFFSARVAAWIGGACALLFVAAPIDAFAQEDTGNETFLSTTSTSTTSTAMVTALGVLTVVTITPKPGNRALRRYLESNAVAVQDTLSTGSGDVVTDLAQAFGVQDMTSQQPAFARVLRAHHATLSPMLDDHIITDEELHAFIVTIYQGMLEHEALVPAARQLEADAREEEEEG